MTRRKQHLPPSTRWLLAFQSFNAVNFTLALGAPLVLTAHYIGASEAQIGLLTTLMPLLVMLQLLAPPTIAKFGCRQVMIKGWGLRSMSLLLIAPLPLLVGVWPAAVLVGVMLLSMLFFTSVRGFAGAAWFPWLQDLLPEDQRGQYFGSEQRLVNFSAFVALVLCGFFLGDEPAPWRYGAIFVVAFGAGMVSAALLKRVPETGSGISDQIKRSSPREILITARRIWQHQPMRRMIQFGVLFSFAVTAQPVFLVLYLKEQLVFSEGLILKFQAAATFGVFLTAMWWGSLSDRIGSRPLMRIFDIGVIAVFSFWTLAALGLYRPSMEVVFLVYFLGGVCMAAHGVANARLMLATAPKSESTFSMALYAVCTSVAGGSAPVLFGLILEQISEPERIPGAHSASFATLFVAFLVLLVGSQTLLSRIPERGRTPTRHVIAQVLYGWPIRVLSGLQVGGNRRSDRD